MSYPAGFSKLRIDDGGTRRMARGEDNIGSRVDEGSSSTSSKDVPSRVDATKVITWLKSVGKSQANAFWKKFPFLLMFVFFFLPWDLILQTIWKRIGVK